MNLIKFKKTKLDIVSEKIKILNNNLNQILSEKNQLIEKIQEKKSIGKTKFDYLNEKINIEQAEQNKILLKIKEKQKILISVM